MFTQVGQGLIDLIGGSKGLPYLDDEIYNKQNCEQSVSMCFGYYFKKMFICQ